MIAALWWQFRRRLGAAGPGAAGSAELRGRIETVPEGGTQYAAEHDHISDEQAERGSGYAADRHKQRIDERQPPGEALVAAASGSVRTAKTP